VQGFLENTGWLVEETLCLREFKAREGLVFKARECLGGEGALGWLWIVKWSFVVISGALALE
jgi:hypothetical protein